MAESESRSAIVLELAEEFLDRYRKGERPPLREYILRHPELAAEIKEVLPAMAIMENIAVADSSLDDDECETLIPDVSKTSAVLLEQLGDYRIIREVGRGGMGVVYEAEQISLGRHVALKVLPNQALADANTRKRFEREAKAAAKLHHTNIVPVFGVGEHDGLPYYAMQFIQGMGLDKVINELARLHRGGNPTRPPAHGDAPRATGAAAPAEVAVEVARSLLTGRFPDTSDAAALAGEADRRGDAAPDMPRPAQAPSDTDRLSDSFPISSSTLSLPGIENETRKRSAKHLTYWQSVANVGRQVADALEYAHVQGVYHRDVKPSNLLMDLRGTVWVTDFGLAKVVDPAATDVDNLTHLGDILGTLRYMPPEAFEGKADARSDIYSLGLTLYEMLTLRPAFEGRDRRRLVKQVTTEEPTAIDKLNPETPRDLATIIHKAIERDPNRRYASAGEFQADLQRFIDDEPIKARRISPVERLGRWARHNRGLAAALAVIAFLLAATALASSLGVVLLSAANERERQANAAAQAARRAAEQEEEKARAQRDVARDHLYLANMNLVQREWESGNTAHVLTLLNDWLPRDPAERDRRGWEWHYQDRLGHGALRVLRGHDKWVSQVACSPDGAKIASAGDDGTIRVWETATGLELLVLRGHRGRVRAVVFSADGSRLYSGGEDGTIRGWTLEGDPSLLLQHKNHATCLVLNRDGTRLASSGRGGILRVWDLAQAKELWSSESRQGDVNSLALSPDGARLASAGDNGAVFLWDMATGTMVQSSSVHVGEVRCVAYSPDGAFLAAAGQHGAVRLWPASGEGEPRLIRTPGTWVYSIAFHPNRPQLATGSDDNMVRLWDLDDGHELRTYQGHTDWIRTVTFTADGTRLVSAGMDGGVRVWNALGARANRQLTCAADGVFSVAFHRDGKQLLSAWKDGKLRVWNHPDDSTPAREFTHGASLEWAAYSPDGTKFASAGRDDAIRIWDSVTGRVLHTLKGHRGDVNCVAFSADGTTLASAGDHGEAFLWDVTQGEKLGMLQANDSELRRVVFHPDGARLVTVGLDGAVRIWDIASRRELLNLQGHQRAVLGLAVNRDGTRLATSSEDGTVRVWDLEAARELHVLQGHRGIVRGIAFNSDGSRLASGGDDGTVRVWEATSGGELRVLRGHSQWVRAVAFSPDGCWLASAGSDGIIQLWDARPWSAKIGADDEARGLVDGLFALPLQKADVCARIESHRGISEPVRRLAQELAQRHAPLPARKSD